MARNKADMRGEEPLVEYIDGSTFPGVPIRMGVAFTAEEFEQALVAAGTVIPEGERGDGQPGRVEAFLTALGARPDFITARIAVRDERRSEAAEGLRELIKGLPVSNTE